MGIAFEARPAEVDEDLGAGRPGASSEETARALALRKALACAARLERPGLVLGADTIVVAPGGALLEKARDAAHARAMLLRLSGRTHVVVTGIALVEAATGRARAGAAVSEVRFHDLEGDPGRLERYLASGLWRGKAGAYGVQDEGSPAASVAGSRSNVVGLPKEALEAMLAEWS